MIETGSLVRVKTTGPWYYGINERNYTAAYEFGPVRVKDVSDQSQSALLAFPSDTEEYKLMSFLFWPLDRLEECGEEAAEPIAVPDSDALFDMIGL